jgi:hypothetical protein
MVPLFTTQKSTSTSSTDSPECAGLICRHPPTSTAKRNKGLPKRVKGELLYFNATKDKLAGSATYDPDKSCGGENDSIVLAQHKSSAAILSGSEESMHLHPSRH